MTENELRETVLAALTEVAPEVEPAEVHPTEPFQDQLDIDSMDFLSFVVALNERTGVEVPEEHYRQVGTLDGAVRYLSERAPAA
jgi:acyl carrier protein